MNVQGALLPLLRRARYAALSFFDLDRLSHEQMVSLAIRSSFCHRSSQGEGEASVEKPLKGSFCNHKTTKMKLSPSHRPL